LRTDKSANGAFAQIAIVTDDSPVEEDVLHLRALADVVDDEVASGLRRLFADHNSDVCNGSTQIPGYEIAGAIVAGVGESGSDCP